MSSAIFTEETLVKYREQTDPLLLDFFRSQKAQIPKSLGYAHQMLENLEEFCTRGGKRLRPALVFYGFKLLGGRKSKDIFKLSLAMELIHTFLLIHDDIIDRSDIRRGKATLHKIYENGNSQRFGETMGILTGDLSFCLAFKLLLSTNFSSELKMKVLQKLQDTIIDTIFGQELDIRLEANGLSKPSEILDVYRLKTAQYTFGCPLHIGAMLTGANQEDLKVISDFAIPAGIAFQIRDDILGLFGDQRKTGKPVGSDLRQGKQTLFIAYALQKGTKDEQKKIKTALGNKNLSKKEVAEIGRIIEKTGALEFAEKLAGEQINQARRALKKFSKQGWDKDTIQKLNTIADFIVERKV